VVEKPWFCSSLFANEINITFVIIIVRSQKQNWIKGIQITILALGSQKSNWIKGVQSAIPT
jgi:hypothetical protein